MTEIAYLDGLIRGVYAKKNLKKGEKISEEDLYLAIPLQKGQLSSREVMRGQVLLKDVDKDKAIFVDAVDTPYAYDSRLQKRIQERGL